MAHTLGKLAGVTRRDEAATAPARASLPRSARRPTSDDLEAIVAAYQAGLTLREVGDQFGFDRSTISSVVQQAGVETRYHQRADVDLDRAQRLQAQGLTLAEVAEHLGIGRTTLVRARRECNAPS